MSYSQQTSVDLCWAEVLEFGCSIAVMYHSELQQLGQVAFRKVAIANADAAGSTDTEILIWRWYRWSHTVIHNASSTFMHSYSPVSQSHVITGIVGLCKACVWDEGLGPFAIGGWFMCLATRAKETDVAAAHRKST